MIVGATPTPDAADPGDRRGPVHTGISCGAFTTRRSARSRMATLVCRPMAPPLVREHRLYQADWLMRFYGFSADELTTPASRTSSWRWTRSWRGRCDIGSGSRWT